MINQLLFHEKCNHDLEIIFRDWKKRHPIAVQDFKEELICIYQHIFEFPESGSEPRMPVWGTRKVLLLTRIQTIKPRWLPLAVHYVLDVRIRNIIVLGITPYNTLSKRAWYLGWDPY